MKKSLTHPLINEQQSNGHIICVHCDVWHQMYLDQQGQCAVCGDYYEQLVVDHCHDTNLVRQLLCERCNHGLGHFKDDPVRLRAAAAYIETQRLKDLHL